MLCRAVLSYICIHIYIYIYIYCAGLRPVPPIRGAVDDDDDSVDDGHDGHDEVDGDFEYATVDDDAGDGEGGV